MSKKKRIKKIFENAPIESADVNDKSTESVPAEAQSAETSPETSPQEEAIEPSSEREESFTENALVSEEANTEIMESIPTDVKNEVISSDENLPEGMETAMDSAESSGEDSSDEADADKDSSEDLLEDVRRSLIEEESDKNQKESKWWRRIGRKSKKVEQDVAQAPIEIDLPSLPVAVQPAEEQEVVSEPKEEVDQIDDLIDMLARAGSSRGYIDGRP